MPRPALFVRRAAWFPTRWGCLALLLAAAAAVVVGMQRGYAFLADGPARGRGVLVVEGWLPDEGLPVAVHLASGTAYRHLYTTGVPIDPGEALAEFGDYARMTEVRLVRAGLAPDRVTAVPAPRARRDRTYTSALALKAWFDEEGITGGDIDLLTLEPHARRSVLLFRRALGSGFRVGAVALPHPRFDRRDWWRTSEGFKTVVMEWLAYPYALWSSR